MADGAVSLADLTCTVCPAQALPLGAFDVVDRPGRESCYDPAVGYRVNSSTGMAVCVHPFRVGLPAGAYASGGVPVPPRTDAVAAPTAAQLELPENVDDLEAWLIATLRVAEPDAMASALRKAETIAAHRFHDKDVVTALRRVLAVELRD